MQRQLTSAEIESVTAQLRNIYREAKLPEELCEKMLVLDVQVLNKVLEWVSKLEKSQTFETVMEATNYYLERSKTMQTRFKEIGCSDEQYKQILNLGSKIKEIDVCKNVFELYQNTIQHITNTATLSDLGFINSSTIGDMANAVEKLYESKSDKTEEDKEILKQTKEMQEGLKDKEFVEFLNMTPEQREQREAEARRSLEEFSSSLDKAIKSLDTTLSKLSFLSDSKSKSEKPDSKSSLDQAGPKLR